MNAVNTIEIFWSLVDKSGGPDACWPWQGTRTKRGYGVFRYQGRQWRAHVLALTFVCGPLPKGEKGLHKCDNPPCCNVRPTHVYAGTNARNSLDMVEHGRQAKGDRHGTRIHGSGFLPRGDAHHARRTPEVMARGEKNGSARFNEQQVRDILQRWVSGESVYAISRSLDCSKGTVQFIVSGETWKHIDRTLYTRRPS
jgi:hypothetical protein